MADGVGKPLTQEQIAPLLKKVSRTADGRGFCLTELRGEGLETDNIEELAKYEHLRHVFLANNAIQDLKPIINLKYILTLDISSNPGIKSLECFNEEVLPHCRTINASKCEIESIGQLKLPRLLEADFRQNKITSLESFAGAETLEKLDLGENQLTTCTGCGNMPALVSLKLDTNELTTMEGLAGLPSLSILELQSNKELKTLNRAALIECPSIKELDVSGNEIPITEFWELQQLPKLRSLKAEGNAEAAKNDLLQNIKEIDTDGNKTYELVGLERLESFNGEPVLDEDREAATEAAQAKKEAAEEAEKARLEELAAAAGGEGGGDDA